MEVSLFCRRAKDFDAIQPLSFWHILGTYFLLVWGGGGGLSKSFSIVRAGRPEKISVGVLGLDGPRSIACLASVHAESQLFPSEFARLRSLGSCRCCRQALRSQRQSREDNDTLDGKRGCLTFAFKTDSSLDQTRLLFESFLAVCRNPYMPNSPKQLQHQNILPKRVWLRLVLVACITHSRVLRWKIAESPQCCTSRNSTISVASAAVTGLRVTPTCSAGGGGVVPLPHFMLQTAS